MLAQAQGLLGSGFVDNPLHDDAGIDNEIGHLSLRPSRTSFSAGVCFRRAVILRSLAAKSSNAISGSSLSVRPRIARASASADCPCRAARRFRRARMSSSRLRMLMPAILADLRNDI